MVKLQNWTPTLSRLIQAKSASRRRRPHNPRTLPAWLAALGELSVCTRRQRTSQGEHNQASSTIGTLKPYTPAQPQCSMLMPPSKGASTPAAANMAPYTDSACVRCPAASKPMAKAGAQDNVSATPMPCKTRPASSQP